MKDATRKQAAVSSYADRLLAYEKKPDSWAIAYALDMDNWSALREESEDVATRAWLRREASERKASALR